MENPDNMIINDVNDMSEMTEINLADQDVAIALEETSAVADDQAKEELKKLARGKRANARGAAKKVGQNVADSALRSLPRKFVVNLKKETDEELARFHEILDALNDSPVGEIPFEDLVWYLVTEKLEESDYRRIREMAFARKIEQARCSYNRENKTDYSLLEFIAATRGDLFA